MRVRSSATATQLDIKTVVILHTLCRGCVRCLHCQNIMMSIHTCMYNYYSFAQVIWVEPGIYTTNKEDTTVRETIGRDSRELPRSPREMVSCHIQPGRWNRLPV